MDLCYCPFGKPCAKCDKKSVNALTDENSRVFPVRRYLDGKGECKFEVFNCASLIGKGIKGAGQLIDASTQMNVPMAVVAKDDESKQKGVYKAYTSGHNKNGVF